MAAAVPRSLDISEQQICVEFPDDANYTWHARVLLHKLTDGGRWVALTPDLEVEVLDVSQLRIVPLARAAPVPSRIHGDCDLFDALMDAQLSVAQQDAGALASVRGSATVAPAPSSATWVFSDPAHPSYGDEVPTDPLRNPNVHVIKLSVGLVE